MSISITIAGTTIDVPNTSENPQWGPSMVQFFRAVESAFSSAIGPYDIAPQILNIDGSLYNPTTVPQNISNLSFSTSTVRVAFIQYAVYRTDSPITLSVVEAGNIIVVYDTLNSSWNLSRDKVGDANITFSIDPTGQIQFITTSIGTGGHLGKISFKATALTNS